MNKLQMTNAELNKLKTQIRAELNQIRFGRQKKSPIYVERSPSHKKHFQRTYDNIFKDVFNPEPQQTVKDHNFNQRRHYRNPSVTPSPRNSHYEKKHFKQQITNFGFTPKASKVPKLSMRRKMKERSRSKSYSNLGYLNSSKEPKQISWKNATVCFKASS